MLCGVVMRVWRSVSSVWVIIYDATWLYMVCSGVVLRQGIIGDLRGKVCVGWTCWELLVVDWRC